ncbi:MAG: hypothetical protein ACSW8E_04765, partial [Clostridia bacterium]
KNEHLTHPEENVTTAIRDSCNYFFYTVGNDLGVDDMGQFAAAFGLVFGPLMYLEYFAINGGWEMFLAMWLNGIPFDLAHCGGNFVLTLVLFQPLFRVMAHFLGDPDKPEKT